MFGRESLEAAVRDHRESTPARHLLDNFQHFIALHDLVGNTRVPGKPSYIINGNAYTYERAILHKQEVLFRVGATSKHALLIGAYLGHALLILLISRPTLHVTLLEDDNSVNTPAIVAYFQEHFPNRVSFYSGSVETCLQHFTDCAFDMIHIDQPHTYMLMTEHMDTLKRISQQGAFFILDGYMDVQSLVDAWIADKTLNYVMISRCLWTCIVTNLCNK